MLKNSKMLPFKKQLILKILKLFDICFVHRFQKTCLWLELSQVSSPYYGFLTCGFTKCGQENNNKFKNQKKIQNKSF